MNLLVIGHTGFLGIKYLEHLEHHYYGTSVTGISLTKLKNKSFKHIEIDEYTSLGSHIAQKPDFLIFLSHAQDSHDCIKAEKKLARDIILFVHHNKVKCPLIMLRSIGRNSEHIESREIFDNLIKNNLKNKVYEVRATIIAEEGSISYEIPSRLVSKFNTLLSYPWFDNKVSLIHSQDIFAIFDSIINGDEEETLLTPKHRTMTYKKYIEEIANKSKKNIRFLRFPFNDFTISPYFVSYMTSFDKEIVKHLMHTLNSDAVL